MLRAGLIAASLIALGGNATAATSALAKQDFSAQPRRLLICTFASSEPGEGFAERQLELVDWPQYKQRDITITELARNRSATHVPTELGPISTSLPLSGTERQRSARLYGCPTNDNTVILFSKTGSEVQRWNDAVQSDHLFKLIDGLSLRMLPTDAVEKDG